MIRLAGGSRGGVEERNDGHSERGTWFQAGRTGSRMKKKSVDPSRVQRRIVYKKRQNRPCQKKTVPGQISVDGGWFVESNEGILERSLGSKAPLLNKISKKKPGGGKKNLSYLRGYCKRVSMKDQKGNSPLLL